MIKLRVALLSHQVACVIKLRVPLLPPSVSACAPRYIKRTCGHAHALPCALMRPRLHYRLPTLCPGADGILAASGEERRLERDTDKEGGD